MDELTALDYLTKPYHVLVKYETYSKKAHLVAFRLMDLKTTELEALTSMFQE